MLLPLPLPMLLPLPMPLPLHAHFACFYLTQRPLLSN
jgi:hypothetical protein